MQLVSRLLAVLLAALARDAKSWGRLSPRPAKAPTWRKLRRLSPSQSRSNRGSSRSMADPFGVAGGKAVGRTCTIHDLLDESTVCYQSFLRACEPAGLSRRDKPGGSPLLSVHSSATYNRGP